MGPPPKYLIERKLIKSIIKKVIPNSPLLPLQYTNGLFDCWKSFGIGNNKCIDQQLKYDFAQQQILGFSTKLKKLGIKQAVMKQVKRPIYPFQQKGRDRRSQKYRQDYLKFLKQI